jgi:malonyl-CoA/methylmalonyl-CoA synthetase
MAAEHNRIEAPRDIRPMGSLFRGLSPCESAALMPSPFVSRLRSFAGSSRPAVVDDATSRSFAELFDRALAASSSLRAGAPSLEGRRVILLATPGAAWVEAFFGVLLGGGVAVPLSPLYPPSELAWFADDAGADAIVISDDLADRAALMTRDRRVFRAADLGDGPAREGQGDATDALSPDATALLLYTSGTTGKPKGAMISHENLAVQARLVGEAWGFHEGDRLLHALPLHHLHGLGISLLTALCAGATARMLPRFDAARVWDELSRGDKSVWMAVPTMYAKLLEAFDAASSASQDRCAGAARSLRLATSGSAALPVTLADRWRKIAGEIPLERFGMTEIGVGLTNPLNPAGRRPGYVGLPLPSVEVKLVDDAGHLSESGPAELWIRGPSVFKGYWGRSDATASAFPDNDGWFRTGDIAERAPDGYIRLLGRTSVDILKSGGYKLSALEIEEALRENAAVAEVAVVGVPDATWGERVVAAVVPVPGREAECEADRLRAWAKDRLASYKIPREVVTVTSLPRNALGKVVKPDLVRALTAGLATPPAGGARP